MDFKRMQVKVKFFALLRERVGRSDALRELPENATVRELWRVLQSDYPGLGNVDMRLLYAVNSDYVGADHVLRDGDEVVFVPPVSGGL